MAQQFSAEEVKAIVPAYKGKVEKFDPSKIKSRKGRALLGKKETPRNDALHSQSFQQKPQRVLTLPKPMLTDQNKTATDQKNDLLISESVFGPNVTVVPIEPRQQFQSSYAAIPQLATEVYREYAKDVAQIDRKLVKEELSYYFTALLWLRLIDIKAKNGLQALTREEKTLQKDTKDENYNVPQPFFTYLASIGSIVDKMGKRTFLETPPLPIAIAQGFGGYHSERVNVDSHNAFEEIPSLGIAGDMLMAVAQVAEEPVRNFHVAFPDLATYSNNLIGNFPIIGPRRVEIRQRLAGFGITHDSFQEYCPNTRFHRQYVKDISDMLGKWETFKIEKTNIPSLTSDGNTTQAIISRPISHEASNDWLKRTVQNTSAEDESTAKMLLLLGVNDQRFGKLVHDSSFPNSLSLMVPSD